MNLWSYIGKQVKIIDISGNVAIGLADIYIPAEDNENEVASLILAPDENDVMWEFEENEIASIEIIPAAASAIAGAI